jgi:hypothetical protein
MQRTCYTDIHAHAYMHTFATTCVCVCRLLVKTDMRELAQENTGNNLTLGFVGALAFRAHVQLFEDCLGICVR